MIWMEFVFEFFNRVCGFCSIIFQLKHGPDRFEYIYVWIYARYKQYDTNNGIGILYIHT